MARDAVRITLRFNDEEAQHLRQIAYAIFGPGVTADIIDAVRYVLKKGFGPTDRELHITKDSPAIKPAPAKRGKKS